MRVLQRSLARIALLVFCCAHLITLTRYPVPSCDEAHYANVGHVFLETGRFGNDMLGKDHPQAVNVPQVGRLLALFLAWMYSTFGLSLFATRLVSLAGFVVALLGVRWAGRLAFDRSSGRLSAVLFALAWITVMHSHNGRPDVWIAAGASLSFASLLKAIQSGQARWAMAAGMAPVVAIDFHLNGIHFLAASGLLLTLWALRRRAWQCWLAFAVTVLIGLSLWYGGHFLYYPYSGDALGSYTEQSGQLSIAGKMMELMIWWWRQYWVGTRYEFLLQGIFFGIGVVWLLSRGDSRGRLVVAYMGLSALSFGLVLLVQADYYRIIWMPFVALVMVQGLRAAAGWLAARFPGRLIGKQHWFRVMATLVIALYVASDLYLLYRFRQVDYDRAVAWLAHRVPEGSLIISDARWWIGIDGRYEFLDDYRLVEITRGHPRAETAPRLAQFLNEVSPAYVLYDGYLGCISLPDKPTREAHRILTRACRRVDTYDDEWFGKNELFACTQVLGD